MSPSWVQFFTAGKYLILAGLMLLLGCSPVVAPTLLPESTPIATQMISDTPAATNSGSGLPVTVQETLPTGLIQVPVPASAVDTARALREAEHPPVDYNRLSVQIMGVDPEMAVSQVSEGTNWQVNDRVDFFINKNLSGDYRPIPARLRYISEHAAWWASITVRADDAAIQAAAQRFEEEILPTNRLIFGSEVTPGIDGDRLIHILLVQEEQWGGYAGYFSAMNQYSQAVRPFSNEKEMFVVNLGGARLDSLNFAGILAHEYAHLIHWSKDPNEDLWLNEASGELSIFLMGVPEGSSALRKTNAELFAGDPGLQLTSRPEQRFGEEDESALAHYAAEKLFAIYLLEQFGPRFVKDVIGNPNPGVFSIQQELDQQVDAPPFDEVYANWILANLLDQPALAQGQFGYQEFDPVPPLWEVIRMASEEPISGRLPPYGTQYYQVDNSGPVVVSFTGSTLARLTPLDPPNGQFVWYSNRGDESEFSLTRSFDLTGLDKATLNYKIWYELEEFFDFAYVEVSTDGGESWQVLETAHGTSEDPKTTSYGIGYTGATIEWLEESIDLSPYAGQAIQLRFEVITDLSTNRDGIQIDDIEIPELGYFDGAEDDSGGWEARGFIRSGNFVPANWIVWLVKPGSPMDITRIELSPEQTAEFEIDGLGEEVPFAALVVSPTAPVTTMDLNYELVLRNP